MKIRKFYSFIFICFLSSPCFSAMKFNGLTSYYDRIEAPLISTITNVTMCAWVNVSTLPQIGTIMGTGDPNGGGYGFGIGFSGGSASTLLVAFELVAWVNCSYTFTTNRWTHVAYTRDSTTMRMYIDGVQNCTSGTTPSNPYAAGRTSVGAMYSSLVTPTAARMFRGTIEDARAYSYALSADEIKYLASTRSFVPYNTSKMLLWLKLNDSPASNYGVYVGTYNVVDSSNFRRSVQTKGSAINFNTGFLNYMGD